MGELERIEEELRKERARREVIEGMIARDKMIAQKKQELFALRHPTLSKGISKAKGYAKERITEAIANAKRPSRRTSSKRTRRVVRYVPVSRIRRIRKTTKKRSKRQSNPFGFKYPTFKYPKFRF